MPLAPQHVRTYFITSVCASRRRIFQTDRNCELMLDAIRSNRQKGRMQIHSFVLMPDHMHLLLTPAPEVSLEKAMQFLKGGFSFLPRSKLDVWQRSFAEQRVADRAGFLAMTAYIEQNPVRAKLVADAGEFAHSSAGRPGWVDPTPAWFLAIAGAEAPSLAHPVSGT
jgi:putative transposase